jgi:hypothetical protein
MRPFLTVCTSACLAACSGSAETHHLPPTLLGMNDRVAPIYDDGERALYEVRLPVGLPVLQPTEAERRALATRGFAPFPRQPWVELSDLSVQVTWMLVNLDRQAHDVEILVDPWNEFGRYSPGLILVNEQDGEALPNLSGIDVRRVVPGSRDAEGRSTRVTGTFTFGDMDELAQDFATVIHIIENVTPPSDGENDPRIAYANHTFHVDNRQGSTPLTDRYRPGTIPALTGFDLGLRTTRPANVAIEIAIEIVDRNGERVRAAGSAEPILNVPRRVYTVGSG